MGKDLNAAIELISAGLPQALGAWESSKQIAGEAAVRILAAWGHLKRFPDEISEKIPILTATVEGNGGDLRNAALPQLDPADWLRRARRLRRVYPDLSSDDAYANFTDAAVALFTELDQSELALWTLTKIGCDVPAETLAWWRKADEWFHDHSDDFFPAADYAEKLANLYRNDLPESDSGLYEITRKYFHLVLKSDALADTSDLAAGLREEWKGRNRREAARIISLFRVASDKAKEAKMKIAAAAGKNDGDDSASLIIEFPMPDRVCRGNIRLEPYRLIVFLQYVDAEGCWPDAGEMRIGENVAPIYDRGMAVFKLDDIRGDSETLPDPILILGGRSCPGNWQFPLIGS